MRNHHNDNRSLDEALQLLEQENMMMNGRAFVLLMAAICLVDGSLFLALGWAIALLTAWGSGFMRSKQGKGLFLLALMLWCSGMFLATMAAVV